MSAGIVKMLKGEYSLNSLYRPVPKSQPKSSNKQLKTDLPHNLIASLSNFPVLLTNFVLQRKMKNICKIHHRFITDVVDKKYISLTINLCTEIVRIYLIQFVLVSLYMLGYLLYITALVSSYQLKLHSSLPMVTVVKVTRALAISFR